jgi:ketosteroid isomerase-like protein
LENTWIFLYFTGLNHQNMKYNPRFPLICAITALLTCSCTNAPETAAVSAPAGTSFNVDSVKSLIRESNERFDHAFATADSAAFLDCYAADACIYNSNAPKLCGTDALKGFFNEAYKTGIRNVKINTEEVTGGKEAVVETGSYTVLGDKGVQLDKGKYMVMWKEENGKWKMHRDIWNTDLPMTAATHAK